MFCLSRWLQLLAQCCRRPRLPDVGDRSRRGGFSSRDMRSSPLIMTGLSGSIGTGTTSLWQLDDVGPVHRIQQLDKAATS